MSTVHYNPTIILSTAPSLLLILNLNAHFTKKMRLIVNLNLLLLKEKKKNSTAHEDTYFNLFPIVPLFRRGGD